MKGPQAFFFKEIQMTMHYRSLCQVNLIGRLGQDAKLLSTKTGTKMAAFSIGTSVSVKNADGTYGQRTSWHDCLMSGARAEKLAQHLQKGMLVSCQGTIAYREVDLANGYKGKTCTIWADDVQILAAPKADEAKSGAAEPAPKPQTAKPAAAQPQAAKAAPAAVPAKAQAPQPVKKPADYAVDTLEEDIPF